MTDAQLAIIVGVGVAVVFILAMLGIALQRPPRDGSVGVSEVRLAGIERRLEEVEKSEAANEHHLSNLRMSMQAMPTKDKIQDIYTDVALMSAEVRGLTATAKTQEKTLDRIEDFLMAAASETVFANKLRDRDKE